MDKKTVEKLIKHLMDLDGPINSAIDIANKIPDEEERKQLRRSLARLAGRIYTDLMIPVCKDFPELLPTHQSELDEREK